MKTENLNRFFEHVSGYKQTCANLAPGRGFKHKFTSKSAFMMFLGGQQNQKVLNKQFIKSSQGINLCRREAFVSPFIQ